MNFKALLGSLITAYHQPIVYLSKFYLLYLIQLFTITYIQIQLKFWWLFTRLHDDFKTWILLKKKKCKSISSHPVNFQWNFCICFLLLLLLRIYVIMSRCAYLRASVLPIATLKLQLFQRYIFCGEPWLKTISDWELQSFSCSKSCSLNVGKIWFCYITPYSLLCWYNCTDEIDSKLKLCSFLRLSNSVSIILWLCRPPG